jgi:hypothetical protein
MAFEAQLVLGSAALIMMASASGAIVGPRKVDPMPMIQTGEIETYYEVAGTGEPTIFIHGLGAAAASWTFQVRAFAPGIASLPTTCAAAMADPVTHPARTRFRSLRSMLECC